MIAAVCLFSLADLAAVRETYSDDSNGDSAYPTDLGCWSDCEWDEYCDKTAIPECAKCVQDPCRPGLLSEKDCQKICSSEYSDGRGRGDTYWLGLGLIL